MSHMPSENLALIGRITPASGAGGNTGWIAVAKFSKILAVGHIGATDHDIDAKIEGAINAAGDSPADITGAAITQIGNASADNKDFMIELKVAKLAKLGFTHVRFSVTGSGGSAALVCGALYGYEPGAVVPGVSRNAASVAQVVTITP